MFKSLMNMFKKDEPQEAVAVTVEPVSDVVKVDPKQEAPKPPVLDSITFSVAGVTMKNEDNKDVQALIRKNARQHLTDIGFKTYGGYTKREIIEDGMEVFEFEDVTLYKEDIRFEEEPSNPYDPNAIKVYLTFVEGEEHHFGYVPKNMTAAVKETLAKDVRRMNAQVVGGKLKKADYDEVVIDDSLSLGVKIEIHYLPEEK